ncbi:MAG TPA: cytochrome c maturation protein CcmE [Herpetosiphonaceae bacterium]
MQNAEMLAAPRKVLGLKPFHWICLALIALTIGLGMSALGKSLTPYVNVVEARAASGPVQVLGFPTDAGAYGADGAFVFGIKDEFGQPLEVHYAQPKPGNFEQAISVVAIGRFDSARNVFVADDLLVKCPSKYQEEGEAAAGAVK